MRLHATIWKDRHENPYPWYYEVDYATDEYPKGDKTIDSLDYGSVESLAVAIEAVEAILTAEASSGKVEA